MLLTACCLHSNMQWKSDKRWFRIVSVIIATPRPGFHVIKPNRHRVCDSSDHLIFSVGVWDCVLLKLRVPCCQPSALSVNLNQTTFTARTVCDRDNRLVAWWRTVAKTRHAVCCSYNTSRRFIAYSPSYSHHMLSIKGYVANYFN